MFPDPDAARDPRTGRPNPPSVGLLAWGLFLIATPAMMVWPALSLLRIGQASLAICSFVVSLIGAAKGIRDVLEFRRRRAAQAQEIRDYQEALSRAVDFTGA